MIGGKYRRLPYYSHHDSTETKGISVFDDDVPIHHMRGDSSMCGVHNPTSSSASLYQVVLTERTRG